MAEYLVIVKNKATESHEEYFLKADYVRQAVETARRVYNKADYDIVDVAKIITKEGWARYDK